MLLPNVFNFLAVILLLVSDAHFSEALWGSRSSSSSGSSSGSRSDLWSGAKDRLASAGRFASEAARGTGSMLDAYKDMREANFKNSDKYFHARGNYDAAKHGPGGAWAAEKLSNAREWFDRRIKGDSPASSAADQRANTWGRSGGDPNIYRPAGLPSKY